LVICGCKFEAELVISSASVFVYVHVWFCFCQKHKYVLCLILMNLSWLVNFKWIIGHLLGTKYSPNEQFDWILFGLIIL
jgi:hypothetical protein